MENSGDAKIVRESPKRCDTKSLSVPSLKEGNVETHPEDVNFASPTPVKAKESPRLKCREDSLEELPTSFIVLSEFYDCMISSLRLLSLRKRTPTFQNVCCQVEILSKRKFLLIHLAQIKHILPEAVQIDKILVHDEKTMCMKPDMKISLVLDVIDGHSEESSFLALSKLFSSRLREFFVKHPKASEVPEAVLPEPFNQRCITLHADTVSKDLSESSDRGHLVKTEPCDTQSLTSHFSSPFKKSFSEKAIAPEKSKTNLLLHPKSIYELSEKNEKISSNSSLEVKFCESTPVKFASGSESLLVRTPVQATPTRSTSSNTLVLTCDEEEKKTFSQNNKPPSSTAKKSLDFYCLGNEDTRDSPQESSVRLSDLVQSICKIFLSINFNPVTKEELIQKIMFNDCEIEDRCAIETQLENLEKIVPEWFYKKHASSGDILYSVKSASKLDLDMVYQKINVE